jgi:uncharacterized protein (DUF58 family)
MARGPGASESHLREQAATLAARLPSLVIAARRIAQSVMHGVHGRRQAGPGETFWQFRPFVSGEPAARVDWRRSARENRAFVREREWEAAHTLWLWFDRSPSMDFGSALAESTKLDRAAILTLALADLAVRGGERVGLLGLSRPIASRAIIDRFAEILAAAARAVGPAPAPLPPPEPIASRSKVVLIGDFLSPGEEVAKSFAALGAAGVEGQALMIADPIEETFPFSGHTEFLQTGGEMQFRTPRAQNLREAYLARLAAQRETVRAASARRGWDFALHRTDQSAAGALLSLTARLSQRGAADFARGA